MRRRFSPARAVIACALSLTACDAGTGGRSVAFEIALEADFGGAAREVTTDTGWVVAFEEACIALGPAYFYERPPLHAKSAHLGSATARPPRGAFERLLDAIVPPAFAHGGDRHFAGGEVVGEWLDQETLDLLESGRAGLPARGVWGRARSFTLRLEPPREPERAPCLRGHHAYVVGVARRDGRAIPFEGGLDLDVSDGGRLLEGLPIDGELDDGARVRLSVNVRSWFRLADFDAIAQSATPNEAGRFVVPPDSQVGAAWRIGVRAFGAVRGVVEAGVVPGSEEGSRSR